MDNSHIEEGEILDKELEFDLLLREARIRFPELEDWILNMAVKAYINNNGEKLVYDKEEAEAHKKTYFQGLEYNTEPADII